MKKLLFGRSMCGKTFLHVNKYLDSKKKVIFVTAKDETKYLNLDKRGFHTCKIEDLGNITDFDKLQVNTETESSFKLLSGIQLKTLFDFIIENAMDENVLIIIDETSNIICEKNTSLFNYLEYLLFETKIKASILMTFQVIGQLVYLCNIANDRCAINALVERKWNLEFI